MANFFRRPRADGEAPTAAVSRSGWYLDPDRSYQERYYDDDQADWTGWVRHVRWDPVYGRPQSADHYLRGYLGAVLWSGGRVVISGADGDHLDLPEHSVSAHVDELPCPGGRKNDLRLTLRFEPSEEQTLRYEAVLLFPSERDVDVRLFEREMQELYGRRHRRSGPRSGMGDPPVRPNPGRTDVPAHDGCQLATRGVLESMMEAEAPAVPSGAGPRHARGFGEVAGREGDRDPATLRGPQPGPSAVTAAREVLRPVVTPTPRPRMLARQVFERVPDTDDWLAFQPLGSSAEVVAPPEAPDGDPEERR